MTSAHLDYEMLADLAEGLLDADKAASADAHLAGCSECTERSEEIAEVSRLLAEAPAPLIPEELATRIDAAIAAEAPPVSELSAARSRRMSRRFQILSAAAAATVLVGGGVAVTQAALESASPVPDAANTASQPMQEPAHGAPEKDAKGYGPSVTVADLPFPVVHTGTDYRRSTLQNQVRSTLGGVTSAAGAESSGRSQRLLGCVGGVSRDKAPLVVDTATFEGGTATVIVLQGTTSDRLDVWIVGPACSASDSDLLQRAQLAR